MVTTPLALWLANNIDTYSMDHRYCIPNIGNHSSWHLDYDIILATYYKHDIGTSPAGTTTD